MATRFTFFIFLLNLSGCETSPMIARSFDKSCHVLEQSIHDISSSRSSAMNSLKAKTLDVGGDTLLIGSRGLLEMRDYLQRIEAQRKFEECQNNDNSCEIVNPMAEGYRVPDDKEIYWGAVLRCKNA